MCTCMYTYVSHRSKQKVASPAETMLTFFSIHRYDGVSRRSNCLKCETLGVLVFDCLVKEVVALLLREKSVHFSVVVVDRHPSLYPNYATKRAT